MRNKEGVILGYGRGLYH